MEKTTGISGGEWKVMRCLWKKSPLTITQLVALLKDETGWTKHTVISLLSRLEAKGAVSYYAGERAKQFFPLLRLQEIQLRETAEFLDRVYGGKPCAMIDLLMKQGLLPDSEAEALNLLLQRKERGESPL